VASEPRGKIALIEGLAAGPRSCRGSRGGAL